MKHLTNKIAKSSLAFIFAGSFAFSSVAFANEEQSDIENLPTVDLQDSTVTEESSTVVTDVSEESDVEDIDTILEDDTEENIEISEDQLEMEVPTLLPGDFFYFIKIALEKIQFAFTFDDVKEAKLLATFTAERLAEAEALFTDGKEDEALKTIEKALEQLESTEEVINEETEEVVNEETEEVVDTEIVNEETISEDGQGTEEETDEPTDESLEDVEKLVSQNILSLQKNLEKVKNPVAKAALEKNIKKSYAKLAKKIAKWESQYGKTVLDEEVEVVEDDDVEVVEEQIQKTPIVTESTIEQEAVSTETEVLPTVPVIVNEEVKSKPNAEKKEAKRVEKVQKAQEKAAVIQEKRAAKEEAKAEKHEAKQERQAAKGNEKQSKGE